MAFIYDPTTSRGRVRMLITDRNADTAIFQDDEIDAFLSMESDSVRLAAAAALETIATDQALVLKVIKMLDLETDGAKLAGSLLQRAKSLRSQENEETGTVMIAENIHDHWGQRERLIKQAMRGAI